MRIFKNILPKKVHTIVTSIMLFPAAMVAQGNLKAKEVAQLGSSTDIVIHAYEERQTGKIVTIYASDKGKEVIKDGAYKGMQITKYMSGVAVGKDRIYQFDENELFIFQNEEGIYTRKYLNDNSFLIRRYILSNDHLQRMNEKAFTGGIETQFYSIENSALIVETDDFEEYGSKYVFYSKDLDVLSSYKPEGGFKESSFASNGKEVLLVLSLPNTNEEKLVVTVDLSSGKLRRESKIALNTRVQFIVPTKDKFVLKTFDKRLIAITTTGQVVWQKENIDIGALNLPGKNNILYEPSNDNLYLLSATKKIIALDGLNGNTLWEKKWSELQPSSSSGAQLRPIAFKSLSAKQQVAVIFGEQTVDGTGHNKFRKLQGYFISSKGEIAATQNYSTDLSTLQLFESRKTKSFYILTNESITRYE